MIQNALFYLFYATFLLKFSSWIELKFSTILNAKQCINIGILIFTLFSKWCYQTERSNEADDKNTFNISIYTYFANVRHAQMQLQTF